MAKLNPDMQAFCEALARKHGIDLHRPDDHLRLSMGGGIKLFLLVLNPATVAVSLSLGDCELVGLVFDTNGVPWELLDFNVPVIRGEVFAVQRSEGVEVINPDLQEKVVDYAERLARDLRKHGWPDALIATPRAA